jgi:hypothetical protein
MHAGTVIGNADTYIDGHYFISRRLPSSDINIIAAQKAGLISHTRRKGRTGPLRQEPLSRPGRAQYQGIPQGDADVRHYLFDRPVSCVWH